MKNFKKKSLILLMAVVCMMTIFVGCGNGDSASKGAKTVTVMNSEGDEVEVPYKPEKVVVLNNSVCEVLCILQADDKIVGTLDSAKFPEVIAEKPKMGSFSQPSIEAILAAKPDLVIGYGLKGGMGKEDVINKITEAGIPFFASNCYKIESLGDDVNALAQIFGKEKRAKEYLGFINKNLDIVNKKLENLKDEDKVTVYWEGYSPYKSAAKGSGADDLMNLSHVANIAKDEPVTYPEVSAEWVLEKNPSMIVKVAPSDVPFGYDVDTAEGMDAVMDELVNRPGWKNLPAVKDNNVHIISNLISTSTRSVVGVCYFVKWAYPDQCGDLNPEAVHKELLEKFYGIDYKGVWTYPEN